MSKEHENEVAESMAKLRELFPEGSRVYLVLRHRSRGGMQRVIGVLALQITEWDRVTNQEQVACFTHPNFLVAGVLGLRVQPKHDGVVVSGVGMDMGFWLVDALSRKLYGKSGALKHEWL